MTNKKTTKKALVLSVLALILCCAMFIGTTLAWFTDTASSANNQIVAGKLDIELEVKVGDEFVNVKELGDATLFGVKYWEPGVVAYETFQAVNEGNLALQYKMLVTYANMNTTNDGHGLDEVIKVAFVKGEEKYEKTDEARQPALDELEFVTLKDLTEENAVTGKLLPKGVEAGDDTPEGFEDDHEAFTVVLYWEPTDVDNLYNLNNGQEAKDGADNLHIDFSVALTAGQVPYEADSFGINYDVNAEMNHFANQIKSAIAQGAENANAKLEEEDLGEKIYFDEEGLQYNEEDGVYEITLNFTEEAQVEDVLAAYVAIKALIGEAVFEEKANIKSINIGGVADRFPEDFDQEGDWVGEDLKTYISNLFEDVTDPFEALQKVKDDGISVTITDVSGAVQVYRMNFALDDMLAALENG